jgi:hypothetical protein
MARPEAYVNRKRRRLDGTFATHQRPAVLIEDRLVMIVANSDEVAPLVRFEHRL